MQFLFVGAGAARTAINPLAIKNLSPTLLSGSNATTISFVDGTDMITSDDFDTVVRRLEIALG